VQYTYRHLNIIVCGDGRRVFDKGLKIVPRTGGDKCVVELYQDGELLARGVGDDLNLAADLVCQQVLQEAASA
jgi:hypothetical protein